MLRPKYSSIYDESFFQEKVQKSLQSARLVSHVICRLFAPRSVVDVGCGLGAWLCALREMGVDRLCGIDGDYVNRKDLLIPSAHFLCQDLTVPFDIPGPYDLALCLEVAEHLSPKTGTNLVHALTQAAPLVLFSAAAPAQGGSHHINEQWPSYWRALFAAEGFRLFDPIRPLIRDNSSVRWWYRQNLLVFACAESITAESQLGNEVEMGMETEWVHISMLNNSADIRDTVRNIPGVPWMWSYLKPWVRPIIRRVQEPNLIKHAG
jgi:hypothetical protein